MIQFVYFVFAFIVCVILACRIDKMYKGETKPEVFFQHALLALAVFGSFVVGFTEYKDWAAVILIAGVLQFFIFSVGRWKQSAPDDTVKTELTELPKESWPHVVGGRK